MIFDDMYFDDEEIDHSDIDYETPAVLPEAETDALERANWHMKMAAMLTAERDQLERVYAIEMDRLKERLAHRKRVVNDRIAWHEQPVEALHLAIVRDNPKRSKTIELPHGTSKVKVPQTPRVQFTDQAATLAWAEKNHPELLGHSINITAVKTIAKEQDGVVADENGEIIPGVEAVLDPPSWSPKYPTH